MNKNKRLRLLLPRFRFVAERFSSTIRGLISLSASVRTSPPSPVTFVSAKLWSVLLRCHFLSMATNQIFFSTANLTLRDCYSRAKQLLKKLVDKSMQTDLIGYWEVTAILNFDWLKSFLDARFRHEI